MSLLGRAQRATFDVTADANGTIQTWPDQAAELFGWAAEEVIGQPLTVLMPKRFHARHTAGLAQVAASGKSHLDGQELALTAVKKDGTEFPIVLVIKLRRRARQLVIVGEIREYPTGRL